MVPGIDTFREKFKDYTDYYTIIGGLPVIFCCQRQTSLFVQQTTLI
jgi:hypothetical protein